MKWLISAFLCLPLGLMSASADSSGCEKSEAGCVLDAAWSAALVLPEDKLARLTPAFLEVASTAEEPDLIAYWENRLGTSAPAPVTYPDFGWQKAEPLLREGGTERLISVAKDRAEPLNFGRADALLSAGKRLMAEDASGAAALNDALLDLTRMASAFEKPNLAHAAAELAMARCDRDRFERALLYTDAPGNLRYAIWRARIDGDVLVLLGRIRAIDSDEDTREVRRVLEGYRAIQEFGYCNARKSQIGG
ncbi:MAG: hypothetical protein NXH78_15475 [Hyphomonadaceae bacterium]|nr:hypothetical protein [Hyphomonadaceae bacterium]